MPNLRIKPADKVEGIIEVPGDKSISHRAVMLSSIAEGKTEIRNFLMGEDCLRTIDAFKEMGIEIEKVSECQSVRVSGKGLRGLKKPKKELYLGNSGTTMRILAGLLSGQDFECVLSGDESLSKRPMRRVAEPLRMMGVEIERVSECQSVRVSECKEIYPPLKIKGRYPLRAIKYKMPVASAQVKSALLLAGLYADGVTEIEGPSESRDHTERMLREFGADIKIEGLKVSIKASTLKSMGELFVPGDISSAAFFIVAALISRASKVTVKDVGINPTRTGLIDVLKKMGANIEVANIKNKDGEPRADMIASSSDLKGMTIGGYYIPRVIDELPILMVAASFADGTTIIEEAGELRVKETDRISSMVTNLRLLGADIDTEGDTIIVKGTGGLKGAEVDSFGDHRTAMSMAIAGLRAEGETIICNSACVDKSFPGFEELFHKLI